LVPASSALPAVPAEIPEEWGINTEAKRAGVTRAQAARGVKHGLLAAIPMICRDTACPYKDFCPAQQRGEVKHGDRCVKEIGEIMDAAERYYAEFAVDPTDSHQRVDAVQIQQLIFMETLMNRASMLLAKGDLVEVIDVAYSPDGQDILQQPQLHRAAEALPKLQRRHGEILQQLMATRKDKVAMQQGGAQSIDQVLATMLGRARQVMARNELLREGKLDEAQDAGFRYGIEQNPVQALPSETIENEPA
jgi:hypothetical protein